MRVPAESDLYFDVRGVFESHVSKGELDDLRSMFGSAGWRTLMEKRIEQAEAVAEIALDPRTDEKERLFARTKLESIRHELSLPDDLEQAVSSVDGKTLDNIEDDVAPLRKPWSLRRLLRLA